MFVYFLRYLFDSYKFFFLDSFETYLVDALDAKYDPDQDKYLVTGHVEGAIPTVTPVTKTENSGTVVEADKKLPTGTAVIDPNGEITITTDTGGGNGNGGGDTYKWIVIDTYKSADFVGPPVLDMILYDQTGNPLTTDDDPVSGQIEIATNEQGGLGSSPGKTYYVKVYNKDRGYFGPYAVRLLLLASDEEPPKPPVPPDPVILGIINDFDLDPNNGSYEPDDDILNEIPTNPAELSLGNNNPLNRYLGFQGDPPVLVDDDWLMFVLPEF